MESTESGKEEEAAAAQPTPPSAFDVFISYSHKDRDFAVALEKALEGHRLPGSLKNGRRNLNVFRDEADIEASEDYHTTIERHLKSSDNLVVICSPDARRSKHVEDEITRFIHHHGVAAVIPVLLRGKANNETELESEKAFPEAISQNRMPLAANFLDYDPGKDRPDREPFRSPFFSVLSAIYKIDRRSLEQIDERMQRRRLATYLGAAAAIILMLSVALVFALISRRQAVVAREEAFARELAANAMAQLPVNPEMGLLLAVHALKTAHSVETENALRQALVKSPVRVFNPGRTVDSLKVTDRQTGDRQRYTRENAVFSPDSRRIMTSRNNIVAVWDVERGKPAFELQHKDKVTGAEYSPDGKTIATLFDTTLQIWDADTGSHISQWDVEQGDMYGFGDITFSPDGRFLLIGGSKTGDIGQAYQSVWEVSAARVVVSIKGRTPTFGHDGKRLLTKAGSYGQSIDDKLYLYDPDGWKLLKTIPTTPETTSRSADGETTLTGPPFGAFSADGRYIVAASATGTGGDSESTVIRLYDANGEFVRDLGPASLGLVSAAFSPDGKLVAAATSDGKTLQILGTSGELKHPFNEPFWLLGCVLFSPDSRYVLSVQKSARLYDVSSRDKRLVAELRGGSDLPIDQAAFSPDGKYILTANSDGTVFVWDMNVWRNSFVARLAPVELDFSLALRTSKTSFSRNGELLVTTDLDNSGEGIARAARVWKVASGELTHTLTQSEAIEHAMLSPDNRLVLTILNPNPRPQPNVITNVISIIRIWELGGGQIHYQFQYNTRVKAAAFSNDSRFVVTATDGSIDIWDVKSKSIYRELLRGKPLTGGVTSMEFSPDDKSLLIVAGEKLKVLDIATEKFLPVTGEGIKKAVFSPDGNLILNWKVGEAGYARERRSTAPEVIDARRGHRLFELHGHVDDLYGVAFSPDSKFIMTVSGYNKEVSPDAVPDLANQVRVWDVSSGSVFYEFRGRNVPLLAGMFRPDGKSVMALAMDGTIIAYDCQMCVSRDELLGLAGKRNLRPLTDDERARYMHDMDEQ